MPSVSEIGELDSRPYGTVTLKSRAVFPEYEEFLFRRTNTTRGQEIRLSDCSWLVLPCFSPKSPSYSLRSLPDSLGLKY